MSGRQSGCRLGEGWAVVRVVTATAMVVVFSLEAPEGVSRGGSLASFFKVALSCCLPSFALAWLPS
jgi:hypothetical protein